MAAKIIYRIIRLSGIFYLFKKVIRRRVAILFYHDPEPAVFKKHIRFLNKHYHFISLDKLVDAITGKNWQAIPDNSLVVTFDDGHKINYQCLETIKEYNVRPTVFCCSDIVGTNRHFWWKEVQVKPAEELKRKKNRERLKILSEQNSYSPEKEYKNRQALNIEEISAMAGFVDFGSHTRFHPVLTVCSSREKEDEIVVSKMHLEKITNRACNHFCFPNGDYDNESIELCKTAGYKSARTIDIGWNHKNSDPFRLKATWVSNDADENKLITQLMGITMYFNYFFYGSFFGRHKTTSIRKH